MGRYGFPIKNQTHIAILSVGIIFKDLLWLFFILFWALFLMTMPCHRSRPLLHIQTHTWREYVSMVYHVEPIRERHEIHEQRLPDG